MSFEIASIKNKGLLRELKQKLENYLGPDASASPLGSSVIQIGLILRSASPAFRKPTLLIFAADHGVGKDVRAMIPNRETYNLVLRFLEDAGPLNRLCKEQNITMRVVDLGVDHHFENLLTYWLNHGSKHINKKVDLGTQDFTQAPAMTTAQCKEAFNAGAELVKQERRQKSNVLIIGAIGVGNQLSALALAAAILDLKQEDLPGNTAGMEIVFKALKKHPKTHDPLTLLTLFGGYEIAAITGAFLQAAEQKMVVMIDGLVAAVALLVAQKLNSKVLEYVLCCDTNNDAAYRFVLKQLDKNPVLNSGISAGDGTGAVLTYPLIKSGLGFLRA